MACQLHGAGFFATPGMSSCLKIGGTARMDADGGAPIAAGVGDRFGFSTLGRLSVDARTPTEWGTVRAFVRMGLQSLTGQSFSGSKSRLADGFGATGVDTFGRAQKGVIIDRAFVQFGGLTAGRASSFYDFYAHDAENIGVTPASDPGAVNLLGWTFTLGSGVSLTVSAEDGTFRRAPVAYSGFYLPGIGPVAGGGWAEMLAGAVPVAPVPAGHDASGRATAFRLIDVRQRNRIPDAVTALRIDGAWGAAQLSAALHEVNVGGFVDAAGAGAPVARRPAGRYGWALQAGTMFKLPALAEGDKIWFQAAVARGALSYTGASQPAGFDGPRGSPGGCIPADMFDGYIGDNGRLHLSTSWSALAVLEHYWRPDLSQSVFAGASGVDFGSGAPAGQGQPGGFSRRLTGNRIIAAGTRLAWSPAPDLTLAAEAAWTGLRSQTPLPDQRQHLLRLRRSDSGWTGKLRVERSF